MDNYPDFDKYASWEFVRALGSSGLPWREQYDAATLVWHWGTQLLASMPSAGHPAYHKLHAVVEAVHHVLAYMESLHNRGGN
jgi:hypothetical protein